MARKLRLALTVSALALTLASPPAHAGTGGPGQAGAGGLLSGLWSQLVSLFAPLDALTEQNGDNLDDKEGGPQGRGYIDPNGTDSADDWS